MGMIRVAAAGLAVSLFCAPANAMITYQLFEVCKFDIEQYCKDIPRKKKKQVKECLEKKNDSLLPRCQNYYKQAK
jgi:hypothetical protein